MWVYLLAIVIIWYTYRWYRDQQRLGNHGDRYVLITGCDTGFGNLLAKELDRLGFHVFAGCLTEIGAADLDKETSKNVKPLQLNVCSEESIRSVFATVKSSLPDGKGLWGIVNNAGISGPPTPIEWCFKEDYEKTLAINTFGMIEVTRIFLPLVLKSKGRVVNMSSVVGRYAMGTAPYAVSKFAVEAYSDVLRLEMYRRGVTVHIIEPGYFITSISDPERICNTYMAQYNKIPADLQKYYGDEFVEESKKILRNGLEKFSSPKVELVTDAYVHALTAKYPRCRYLVGNDAKYSLRLLWNLPEWLSDYLLSKSRPIPVAER